MAKEKPPKKANAGESTEKPKKPIFKRWWFWLFIVLVVGYMAILAVPTDSGTETAAPSPTASATEVPEKTPEPTPVPVKDKEWLSHITPDDIKTNTGEILSVIFNGTDLVVKQKINSQMTNKLTIDQNYYNACEIIRSLAGADFSDLQYWAVADMQDGSEGKVISFTVPADAVRYIMDHPDYPDNTLGQFVKDLWILPSLQD